MNYRISYLIILFPVLIFAQEIKKEKDSISNAIKNLYIEDHNNQLNIKFVN